MELKSVASDLFAIALNIVVITMVSLGLAGRADGAPALVTAFYRLSIACSAVGIALSLASLVGSDSAADDEAGQRRRKCFRYLQAAVSISMLVAASALSGVILMSEDELPRLAFGLAITYLTLAGFVLAFVCCCTVVSAMSLALLALGRHNSVAPDV